MGGRQARRLCPRRDRRPAADGGLLRGEQGRLRGLQRHDAAGRAALDRRGVPGRRRAAAGRPARRPRSPPRCGATSASEVGLAITVGVARTKFLAKVASGVGKPDGLLVVPLDGELTFLHPLPVERLWGVGAITAGEAARARHHHRRRGRRPRTARARRRCSGRRRAVTCTRSRTTATRVRSGRAAPSLDRVASARSAAGASRRPSSTPRLVGLVDRVCAPAAQRERLCRTVVLRLRFDDFARVTRSHTLPRATADTAAMLTALRGLLATALAADRGQRSDTDRHLAGQPRRRRTSASRTAVRTVSSTASTARWTGSATGTAARRSPGPCCSGATPASSMPVLPD